MFNIYSSFSFFISLFISLPTLANTLGLEFSQSSQSKSQELSASGILGQDNAPFDWDFSYTHIGSKVTDKTSGTEIIDDTHDISVGTGYEFDTKLQLGAGFNYSTTPSENLRSLGPRLSLGYVFKTDSSDTSKNEHENLFFPTYGIEIILEESTYTQNFGVRTRRRSSTTTLPSSGKNEIQQTSVTASMKYQPLSWVKFKLDYTAYSYNKDVSQFIQYLDIKDSLSQTSSSGFSNALAGFYENTLSGSIRFYFPEDWQLDFRHSRSLVEADKSLVLSDKLMVTKNIGSSWQAGLGVQNTKSNASQASATTSQSVVFNVDYDL